VEDPQTSRSALAHRIAPLAIGATVALVLFAIYKPFPIGVAQDDGLYMILAKAISTGQGYRFINLPGAPAGVHYPPGYPLLLAALSSLTSGIPGNPLVFAAANMIFLGLGASFLYILARRIGMRTALAAGCALAGFLMPPAVWMNTALFSEPMWLGLAIPWLVWADRADRDATIDARMAIMLGASAGCIALVRTQAAALALALVCVLAARRRWKPAFLVMVATTLVLLPWQLFMARHAAEIPEPISAKYGPYFAWFVQGLRAEGPRLLIATIIRNVGSSFAIIRKLFAPVGGPWLAILLLGAPGVAAAWRLARRAPVVFMAVIAHAAIILVWPFEPQRFIWTSWPFVVLWLCAGAAELWEQAQRISVRRWGPARIFVAADSALLGLAAVGTTAFMLWTGAYRAIARGQAKRITPTVAWVQQHTPPGTLVASDDETAVFLYTGRRAVPVSSFSAADYAHGEGWSESALGAVVTTYKPDVAIVSWNKSVDAAMRMTGGPQPTLRPVDRTTSSVIFERIKPASEGPIARGPDGATPR
jgi:hypothetical protein